jgi:raffinose/stachyose/melibiose transport system permease protein
MKASIENGDGWFPMAFIKKLPGNLLMYGVLLFTIVVSVFPILWIIMGSFKSNGEIINGPFVLPSVINFNAYFYLFTQYNFLLYTFNSLVCSFIPTIISLIFFTMGAYAIAKYNFPGKYIFYTLFVITMLVPAYSRTQPIFSLVIGLNLYDTRAGLMLVYLSSGMAVSMFILKATFQSIPPELNEAATLDGASFFQTFWRIDMPLAKNGLATAGVLMFLSNWNEFYYANLLIATTSNRTLPVVTILFNSMFNYNYTNTFAALTLVVIPGIIFYALAQKQVQASIISSAIKG